MLKTRRLHRRENEKERLYDALRALYADGVRVCTGRAPKRSVETAPAASREPAARPTPASRGLSLLDDTSRNGNDPYNTSGR